MFLLTIKTAYGHNAVPRASGDLASFEYCQSANALKVRCRAFVKEMSSFGSTQFDAAAVSTGRHLPVESAMPGTTLQIIPLEAFESGGVLYGTKLQLIIIADQ